MASWLDQDTEFLTWKRRLRFDLMDWKNPKTPGSYLLGGVLNRARTWLRERPDEHSAEERRFIQASFSRRVLWRCGLGGAMAAVAAIATLGVLAAIRSQIRQQVDWAAEQLTQNPGLALLLAYDAAKSDNSQHTREVFQRAVQQASTAPLLEGDDLTDIALSADGALLAAVVPGSVLVWTPAPDASDPMIWSPLRIPEPKQLPFEGRPTRVAVSPNSKVIAAGDDTGKVMVWKDGQPTPGTLVQAGSRIVAMAFSLNGHLAIATEDNQVVWWNVVTSQEERRVRASAPVWSIAVSLDSSTIAAGMQDGFVRFWKPLADGWQDGPGIQGQVVNFVSFAKNGRFVESASRLGKSAYRWSRADPRLSLSMHVNDELMDWEAADGDGRLLAVHTTSGSIVIFNAETGRVELYIPHQAPDIRKVVMDSKGALLAAMAPNGVRIYELSDNPLAARARIILRDFTIDERDCERFLKASECEEDLKEIR
jgi:WD40 repeat protein